MLAIMGLFGLLNVMVASRVHEIGFRMALGAQRRQVLKLILTQSLTVCSIGMVVGLVLSLGLARFIRGLLFQVGATDGSTYLLATLFLISAAFLASLIPAYRAAKVDPMEALRYE